MAKIFRMIHQKLYQKGRGGKRFILSYENRLEDSYCDMLKII
jgi:hypothetical protein